MEGELYPLYNKLVEISYLLQQQPIIKVDNKYLRVQSIEGRIVSEGEFIRLEEVKANIIDNLGHTWENVVRHKEMYVSKSAVRDITPITERTED